MRYISMVKSRENLPSPPPPELMGAIAQLGEEATRAGAFVDTGWMMPTATGAEMSLRNGQIEVTDGPFAEGKEVIGGFAVYDTPTKEETLEWVRRFLELHQKHWPDFEGVVEVRQMMGMDGLSPA